MPFPLRRARSLVIADAERSSMPTSLVPKRSPAILPAADVRDLRRMRDAGFDRYGVVAAIVDDLGRLLMLSHVGNSKTPDGALGPLAETAKLAINGDDISVEATAQTLLRGVREELGIEDTDSIGFRARRAGGWVLNNWPVGTAYANQTALAVCPVLHVDAAGAQAILDSFQPNDEISGIRFMSPGEIRQAPNLRDGTQAWLGDLVASGLLELQADTDLVVVGDAQMLLGELRDVRFDEVPEV